MLRAFSLLVVTLIFSTSVNAESLRFTVLNSSGGLPQNSIRAIVQDQNGLMWFATEDGIARYDGHEIYTYRYDPDISHPIPDNVANQIIAVSENQVWISLQGGAGVTVLNQSSQTFDELQGTLESGNSIGDSVTAMFEKSKDEIVIGSKNGIFSVSTNNLSITKQWIPGDQFQHEAEINALWIGQNNNLWFASQNGELGYITEAGSLTMIENQLDNIIAVKSISGIGDVIVAGKTGLLSVDYENNQLTPLFIDSFLKKRNVRDVVQSSDGNLWIATRSGLIRYNLEEQVAELAEKNVADANALPTNELTKLYISDDEMLWIGTTDKGVIRTNLKKYGFTSYSVNNLKVIHPITQNKNKSDSFKNNMIWSIFRDKADTLWIGHSEGISRQDAGKETYTNLTQIGGGNTKFDVSESWIMSIHETKDHLWFGTWGEGLIRYSPTTQEVTVYSTETSDPKFRLSGNIIRLLLWDEQRNSLWVGTHRNGLNQINLTTDNINYYLPDSNDDNSFPHARSRALYLDTKNTFWIGSGSGLARFSDKNKNFELVNQFPEGESVSDVRGIFQSDESTLWAANAYGLDRINSTELRVEERLLEKDGLSRSALYGIVPDNNGVLWIPTIMGLTRFNPKTNDFKRYFVDHNIQSNEFNFGALWKEKDGGIILGGTGGITKFQPDNVVEGYESKNPVILRIKAVNKFLEEETVLGVTTTSMENSLELNSDQRSLIIDFTTPEYTFQANISYLYRLKGNDKKWIAADSRDVPVRYTNLPHGQYTFQVQTVDDSLENNEILAIDFHIEPYFWEQLWFRFLSALVTLAVLTYVFIYYNKKRVDASLEAMTRQHYHILEHELSPQLTQANNNLTTLVNSSTTLDRDFVNTSIMPLMHRSLRFLDSVRDIVDFEHAVTQPRHMYMLEDIVDEVLLHFANDGGRIKIDIIEDVNVFTHQDALYLLLTNLISNALKYSDTNLDVHLKISAKNRNLKIRCSDNGFGITTEKRNIIYNKYSRLPQTNKSIAGLGLGLTIVKSIVHAYSGNIKIENNNPKGSIFIVTLKGVVASGK